ncbi:MAG: ABC transporter permease subunit [Thiomonas sp.]|nr:ABC transporter permease subunit [Thiomonas sp.]
MRVWRFAAPFVAALLLLGLWQLGSQTLSPGVLPPPAAVLKALLISLGESRIWRDSFITLGNVLVSFLIALFGGLLLGLAAFRVRALADLLHPLMVTVESAPTIAWLVLAILWLGLGQGPSILVGVSMALPLIFIATLHALQQIDNDLLDMARVFHIGLRKRMLRIILPSLALTLAGAASGTLSVAWRGVIMAEAFSSSSGLGPYLWGSYLYGEITQVYASILWIVLLGLLIEYAFIHPVRLWLLSRLHHSKA